MPASVEDYTITGPIGKFGIKRGTTKNNKPYASFSMGVRRRDRDGEYVWKNRSVMVFGERAVANIETAGPGSIVRVKGEPASDVYDDKPQFKVFSYDVVHIDKEPNGPKKSMHETSETPF